jgi:dTDP-4-dehydrorhamnose 3,5-epimerase
MRFTPLQIEGAWLVEQEPHADARGSFARTFCEREFAAQGLAIHFPQHSRSRNATRGTLRGMHLQKAPHAEAKLVTCVTGAVFDVCLDLRPASASFRRWVGYELSPDNGRQLYIPEGCAHGFLTLADNSEVHYLISEFYAPGAAMGVRYNDPQFAIEWPGEVMVISDKDRDLPDFAG